MKIISICTVLSLLTLVACNTIENIDGENTIPIVSEENLEEENGGDIVITMAICYNIEKPIKEAINNFNKADNGYQIVLKDYHEYYDSSYDNGNGETPEGAKSIDTHLDLDIIKGGVVDIVFDMAYSDKGKFENLANKGAFTDLKQFMEQDQEINYTTLNNHVLELYEIDNKLYTLPTFFTVETLIGKSSFVGFKENWNIDNLIEYWDKMPNNSRFNFSYATKDSVYLSLLRGNVDSFIDSHKAKTSFNSPEFIKIIDFCNSFPNSNGTKTDPDWDAPIFISECRLGGINDFHTLLWNEDNEDYTFVGYPSYDENGAFIDSFGYRYGICVNSSKETQDGAWQFLRSLVSYDFQYKYGNDFDFEEAALPINQNAFETLANDLIANTEDTNFLEVNDMEYDIGLLTQEEYERLVEYINSVKRVKSYIDEPLWNIINEELNKFFQGEATAEQTAESIQFRTEILISERQ